MKRILVTLILCSLLSIASCSKNAGPQSLPTADQVLDAYVKALGGQAAIEKVTSRFTKSSISVRGQTGSVENYAKAPSKYMSVIVTPDGTTREGFDGASGWGIDPTGRLRDWTGDEIASSSRNRNFYRDTQIKSMYPRIAVTGKEDLDGKEVYVLELTPNSGSPEKMYFDTQTGLLLEQYYEVMGPQGARPFLYAYDDYRDVDGVKVPFTIKRMKPSGYELKVAEVKNNIAMSDDQFKRPSNP